MMSYEDENLVALRDAILEALELEHDDVDDLIEQLDLSDDQSLDIDGAEYRLIPEDAIDDIQIEELANDEYVLGGFNASFLAGILGIPTEAVEKIQAAECYEALGMLITADADKLSMLQRDYSAIDGYGHHFAHYDHETIEFYVNDRNWYLFRTN